jgi:outer membrane biosynthesis protein TonB
MRAGFTVSIIGHAAILGFGLLAFASSKPLEAEKIEALPVDLVTTAEVTDLLQGDKSSKVVPEEKPQPAPSIEAKAPAPKPEEKPAEKPIEAVTPPPPPPPPPEPEPKPEPEPEVAALPPAPDVRVEPEPAPVAEAPVPKPRPAPPKPEAKPKPEPPKPPAVEAKKEEKEFNADDIAALLNKQDPAGGGTPTPNPDPQTLGSIEGHEGAAMTQSEIAALKARLYRCWNPPVAVREAGALVVEVRITLLPDGSLSGQPQIVGVSMASDPLSQVAAEAAIRAVVQCAPFGDILRPETYALWNQINFVFDPREMLGG